MLIAGDMLSGFGTIVIDPPEGDMTDYLESLERLAELRPRFLFPAHGPVLDDAEGKLRACARHRLWREGRVRDAWGARPARAGAACWTRSIRISRRRRGRWPRRQIVAHLERLERRGEAAGLMPAARKRAGGHRSARPG